MQNVSEAQNTHSHRVVLLFFVATFAFRWPICLYWFRNFLLSAIVLWSLWSNNKNHHHTHHKFTFFYWTTVCERLFFHCQSNRYTIEIKSACFCKTKNSENFSHEINIIVHTHLIKCMHKKVIKNTHCPTLSLSRALYDEREIVFASSKKICIYLWWGKML